MNSGSPIVKASNEGHLFLGLKSVFLESLVYMTGSFPKTLEVEFGHWRTMNKSN
jgi:hypothetical protein